MDILKDSENNYPNCATDNKVQVKQDLEAVQIKKSNSTDTEPNYTNRLQGEERLSEEDISILASMNEKYSHIVIGGKHKIVSTKHCPVNGMTTSFEDVSQFNKYFEHEKKINGLNRGSAWFKWESKSIYRNGVGFYPNINDCPDGVYNFYKGLAIEPEKGDCSVYLNHIKEGICGGDHQAAEYFIQWLAHMIQKPEEKPSVAILMKSLEGTGKGTLVEPLKQMLGEHSAHVNGHYNLTQRFNGTVANKILIFGDEVDLKEKRVADKLKGLISERVIQLERKGIEPEPMPNYSRFIFASNHSQVIYAGLKERRYLMLEPVLKDKIYYDSIHTWINKGGASYLLHYLAGLDITNFNKHKAPITKTLVDEKLCSLPHVMEFIYSEISKEKPFDGKARIFASDLVNDFSLWLENSGKESKSVAARRKLIGDAMKNLSISSEGRSGRGNGKYYDINNINMKDRFYQFIST
ncbi:DUF5906 domain-containing protein [Thalassotalea eurytherma]|uniref:NrS-1 polymerase-like helicase domain-containing protein n=1 Tax=Thalassotalea eurytherma TaxID=1144278 RepID=A0ABQ6H4N4_9GAMM|nr:DUF5906 domain-containing protein [Thalassotalea eurytherma]GLX82479.1 hypothetical protein theurythT_19310 [Thalassotalea eurytherma]